MDVIWFILKIFGWLMLLCLVGSLIYLAWKILLRLWVIILAIILTIWLWKIGHDNLAVMIFIGGIILEIVWYRFIVAKLDLDDFDTISDPMENKKTKYDKDGNIIGYED